MKKQRILSLILAALMVAAVFAGCGQSDATNTASPSAAESKESSALDAAPSAAKTEEIDVDTYDYSKYLKPDGRTFVRVAMGSDPGTYDPAKFGGITGINATSPMFRESLYERDENGNLINQIAKSYSMESDNLTYHVEIYDYVHDSAGNKITADDIVFCFMRAKELGFNSTSYYDSVTKDDDYNVTIKLNNTAMGVFEQVVQVITIYSQKAYEEAGEDFGSTSETAIFTGAYKMTEWIVGTSVTLEKDENYWQKDELRNIYAAANVDVVEFSIIKEAAQLAIALETDKLDMVYDMKPLETQRFMEGGSSSEGFNVYEFTNRNSLLMYLNLSSNSIFKNDSELRNAVMYSIDMDGLIYGTVDGLGVSCKTFGNSMIGDYQAKWDNENYFNYDLTYAKECLAKSGYKGETIRIMGKNNELQTGIAQVLQSFLLEAGINAEILTYEDALFNTYKYDDTQWDIQLDQTSWNGPTVTTWRDKFDRRTFHDGKGGFISTDDDKFQSLLETALDITTYSAENVDAFHQYLKEQAYARGLFNQLSYSVTTDCVVEYMNYRAGALYPAGCTYVWNVK